MYILFINSGGKCNIFFSTQFNNNSNKKKLSNPWVQPDPTQPMWVGLGWTYVMGWVEFFFLSTMIGWVKKSSQPDPCTPLTFVSNFIPNNLSCSISKIS